MAIRTGQSDKIALDGVVPSFTASAYTSHSGPFLTSAYAEDRDLELLSRLYKRPHTAQPNQELDIYSFQVGHIPGHDFISNRRPAMPIATALIGKPTPLIIRVGSVSSLVSS